MLRLSVQYGKLKINLTISVNDILKALKLL